MAAPKKTVAKKTPSAPKPQSAKAPEAQAAPRKSKVRILIGLLFLCLGALISLSIVSYFFTWQTDQDLILRSEGLKDFVMNGKETIVANWVGRLGAATAHYLVFRGAGLASLAIGLFAVSIGLHIIYGRRMAPAMRYLRWTCLILLTAAPILAYLFPETDFPFGGALGTETVLFSNGFIGKAGTGIVLLALAFFVVFVIFALDISPMIRRARRAARKMREGLQQFRAEDEAAPLVTPQSGSTGGIATTAVPSPEVDVAPEKATVDGNLADVDAPVLGAIVEHPATGKQYEMGTVEKAQPAKPLIPAPDSVPFVITNDQHSDGSAPAPTEEIVDEEEAAFQAYMAEQEAKKHATQTPAAASNLIINTPEPEPEYVAVEQQPQYHPQPLHEPAIPQRQTLPELSFEVTQQAEQPAAATIKHGDHISIENAEPYAPELDLPDYRFPTLDLLEHRSQETIALNKEELEQNKAQIEKTLNSFGITIQRISATVGPTVTLYEIVPAEGVRISKIRNLEDDIALNLSALGIRIIAPIPGKGTIGIEVPNANKQIVSMRTLLSSEKFVNNKMSLPIALGKQINNENYIVDLATMPHLLMAGATGQGKSVGINAILVSLLYKKHPSQLKFVMVDPKKVELSVYRLIEKHFLAKLPNEEEAIITDTKKVINTLNALCIEMDNRYESLKDAGTRNIKEYNEKFIARRLNPAKGHKYLPFIVLVVDEFADLIMTAGKEVEMPIARLAQLARAVGIHLIVATQRPSVNVITGTIKANFPARIAFKVSAKVDSRTILDAGGAEQLVGRGDMLVSHGSELLRLQCAFVDTPEVEEIVNFIGSQRGYPHAFELPEYEGDETDSDRGSVDLSNRDKLFEDCARTVVSTQSGSTSNLQRKFNLGYNRAGRIMDQLEAASIVGPAMGSKPREVYFKTEAELEQFLDSIP